MRDLLPPDEIREFDRMGGAVHYSFFVNAEGSDADLEGAILWHCAKVLEKEYITGWIEPAKLRTLPRGVIDRKAFFGDWYDMERDALIYRGGGRVDDGRELVDPTYDEMGRAKIKLWGSGCPDVGSGGNYAFAFSQPPYSGQMARLEVQDMFRRINKLILPAEGGEIITDWSSKQLADFCEHFEHGMEYWGVFLFTIFDPATQRLTVISASTSD